MTPKVSIILPVYNGANYVLRAIDSILKQTLQEIEVIVVDDGSTDNTLNIVKNVEDKRVRVLSKINEGVSVARNVGIEAAKGEYIGFVDADDRVKNDMYEVLYKKADGADVVCSSLQIERDGVFICKKGLLGEKHVYTQQDFEREILEKFLIIEDLDLLVVMNKLYRRSFLLEKKISFLPTIAIEEDGLFNLKVYLTMQQLINVRYAGYYYLENKESVTRDIVGSQLFEKLIQRFEYDYRVIFELPFSDVDLLSFKASRLIHSVSFLVYRIAITKLSIADKMYHLSKILENNQVHLAVSNLNIYYTTNSSKFEKVLVYCIRREQYSILKGIVLALSFMNKIGLIQWLRRLNDMR